MWKGAEDQLGLRDRCVVSCNEGDFASAEPRTFAALGVRRGVRQLELGMRVDQGAELTPGVSGRAEDAHRDSMHTECISTHSAQVNG